MKLSRNQKLVVGGATLWMLVYPLLFICGWLMMVTIIATTANARQGPPPVLFAPLACIFPIHLLTIGIIFALMIFYWAHIIKNNAAADVWRIIFGVGVFLFGFIAMPLYFIFFVWRAETPEWARPKPPSSDTNVLVP